MADAILGGAASFARYNGLWVAERIVDGQVLGGAALSALRLELDFCLGFSR